MSALSALSAMSTISTYKSIRMRRNALVMEMDRIAKSDSFFDVITEMPVSNAAKWCEC